MFRSRFVTELQAFSQWQCLGVRPFLGTWSSARVSSTDPEEITSNMLHASDIVGTV